MTLNQLKWREPRLAELTFFRVCSEVVPTRLHGTVPSERQVQRRVCWAHEGLHSYSSAERRSTFWLAYGLAVNFEDLVSSFQSRRSSWASREDGPDRESVVVPSRTKPALLKVSG